MSERSSSARAMSKDPPRAAARRSTRRAVLCVALGFLVSVGVMWMPEALGVLWNEWNLRRSLPASTPMPATPGGAAASVKTQRFVDRASRFAGGRRRTIWSDDYRFTGFFGATPWENVPPTRTLPPWLDEMIGTDEFGLSPDDTWFELRSFGLPWRAACRSTVYDARTAASSAGARTRGTLTLRLSETAAITLPVRLHAGRVAANCLFWSAVFAVPMLAVPAARRGLRRRRGRCVACGYSRSGLDATAPCPECGQSS